MSGLAGSDTTSLVARVDEAADREIKYVIKFIGEGAANVVVEVILPNGKNAFPGNLLRLPKAGTVAYPYSQLQSYWESSIRPRFEEGDLVRQSVITLDDPTLPSHVNELLQRLGPNRRQDFVTSRVAELGQGMLVEDMRKQQEDDIVLEFKPKWLSSSPSAPLKSKRCRNCAREAQKVHKKGSTDGSGSLCPLNLVGRAQDQEVAAQSLLPNLPTQQKRVLKWLQSPNVITRLRDLQTQLDRNGPLEVHHDDKDFALAMTLRDCTCFVRIPANGNKPIEAKLGDLDQKNAEGKTEYWRKTERHLIDGGFYHGEETPAVAIRCMLGQS